MARKVQPMFTEKTLFHVTHPANVAAILREGLRADEDGWIFAITDDRLANSIARDQVGLPAYTLLEIDGAGINGKILPDRVGELSARWHRIIVQPLIAPEFVRVLYTADTHPGPTEGDYMRYAIIHWSRDQVDQMYAKAQQDDTKGR
jgi:hypothetical protein